MQSNADNEVYSSNLVRMNLNVAPDVPEKLRELAGGKFRMGEWLSRLIGEVYEAHGQGDPVGTMDAEGVRLMILGLAGQLKSLQGEVVRLQSAVAAIKAEKG